MHRFAATLLFSLPLFAGAAPELSGTPDELSHYLLEQKKIVTIQSEAEEKVEADRALVTVSVRTREGQLHQALAKNEALRQTLRERLQQAGIAAQDIKAARFSSTPNYGWFGDRPSSYEVRNEVRIAITDEAQLQAIARLVDDQREIYFGTLELEDSAAEANKRKVLETALDRVQEKRGVYEARLGIRLTPLRIGTPSVFAHTPQLRRVLPETADQERLAAGSGPVEAGGDFGSITYHADILVEFIVNDAQ